jgi:hypothetical protein
MVIVIVINKQLVLLKPKAHSAVSGISSMTLCLFLYPHEVSFQLIVATDTV